MGIKLVTNFLQVLELTSFFGSGLFVGLKLFVPGIGLGIIGFALAIVVGELMIMEVKTNGI